MPNKGCLSSPNTDKSEGMDWPQNMICASILGALYFLCAWAHLTIWDVRKRPAIYAVSVALVYETKKTVVQLMVIFKVSLASYCF
jgi:hypothetical protein